jgi:hypothetical protein
MPVSIKNKDEAAQMVSKLGSQRINNIFTHLRKICQHPLLVRHHFNDDKVKEIAEVASANKLFGGNCTVPRVLQEISGGCCCSYCCCLYVPQWAPLLSVPSLRMVSCVFVVGLPLPLLLACHSHLSCTKPALCSSCNPLSLACVLMQCVTALTSRRQVKQNLEQRFPVR